MKGKQKGKFIEPDYPIKDYQRQTPVSRWDAHKKHRKEDGGKGAKQYPRLKSQGGTSPVGVKNVEGATSEGQRPNPGCNPFERKARGKAIKTKLMTLSWNACGKDSQ